jgi:hypothetical protein
MTGLVVIFLCMVYKKKKSYMNRKRYNYDTNSILRKIRQKLCSISKNAADFPVAQIYIMNFYG